MDAIERLIATDTLKTSLLSELLGEKAPLFLHYDDEIDTLILLLASPNTETVVHYVNDDVALLYTPEKLEIVGLQIEDFQSEFIHLYSSLQKVWRFSKCGIKPNSNVRDLTLAVKEQQLSVALEVVRAAQPLIGPPAKKIEKVLEYA